LIGSVVSHSKIVRKLGSGGMGVVYEAEDLTLGRRVALKFLPSDVAQSPQSLERFRMEARTASSINHENICTIYETSEHERQPFIAMELLEGEPLSSRLLGAAFATDQLLDLGIQVPMLSMPRTAKALFIATSSRQTFSSPLAGGPRSSISAWQSLLASTNRWR
jgi:non-specific serine/threonine protein kinase